MPDQPKDPAGDYLRRLDRAMADLPADRRREVIEEIGEHIATADPGRPGDLERLLDRLGPPEAIAAAAREDAGLPARGRPGPLELAAIVLLVIGPILTAGFGSVAGLVLLWLSPAWPRARKVLGTVLAVVPIAAIVAVNVIDAIRPGDGVATAADLATWASFLLVPLALARFLGRPLWPGGWADLKASLRGRGAGAAAPALPDPGAGAAALAAERVGWFAGRTLAGWGTRAAAFGIDLLLVAVAVAAAGLVPVLANRAGGRLPDAVAAALLVATFVLPVAVGVWNQGIEQGRSGRSLGKRVFGLRVVRLTTLEPLGPAAGFARLVVRQVVDEGLWGVGLLWPLWDARRQTLADKAVGSVVLDERRDGSDRVRSSWGAQAAVIITAVAGGIALLVLFLWFWWVSAGP